MKQPHTVFASYLIPALLLLTPSEGHAEAALRQNWVSLNLGGEGMLASVHYERLLFSPADRIRLLADVGVGYFPAFANGKTIFGTALLPLGLRGLYGFGDHHVQAGLAVTTTVLLDDAGRDEGLLWGSYLTPSLGYRYSDLVAGRWSLGFAYAPRVAKGVTGLRCDHNVRAEIGVLF